MFVFWPNQLNINYYNSYNSQGGRTLIYIYTRNKFQDRYKTQDQCPLKSLLLDFFSNVGGSFAFRLNNLVQKEFWPQSGQNRMKTKKKLSLVETTFAEFPFQYLPLLCYQIWIYRCAFYLTTGWVYLVVFPALKIVPTPPKNCRCANFSTTFIILTEVLPLPTVPTRPHPPVQGSAWERLWHQSGQNCMKKKSGIFKKGKFSHFKFACYYHLLTWQCSLKK